MISYIDIGEEPPEYLGDILPAISKPQWRF